LGSHLFFVLVEIENEDSIFSSYLNLGPVPVPDKDVLLMIFSIFPCFTHCSDGEPAGLLLLLAGPVHAGGGARPRQLQPQVREGGGDTLFNFKGTFSPEMCAR
jgi:hypothetical protein